MKYTYFIIKSIHYSTADSDRLIFMAQFHKINISISIKKSKYITANKCTHLLGRQWLQKTGIKAIKTAAQTAIATIGTSPVIMNDINWTVTASASMLSAIISILNSIVKIPEDLNNQ